MGFERSDDLLEVTADGIDGYFDLDVICAHQEYHRFRVEREYVFL